MSVRVQLFVRTLTHQSLSMPIMSMKNSITSPFTWFLANFQRTESNGAIFDAIYSTATDVSTATYTMQYMTDHVV
eukprot:scaffold20971_cov225-Skeletonema_marinoi.AAC.1